MRTLPRSLGPIHFVGIGGIGMSGIAEVLHNLGYTVQGSDLADGANTRRLAELGVHVSIGHAAENLGPAQVVVVASAVKGDNPEVVAARARRTPVVRRAEMLGELMRLRWSIAVAGTHGKTTTTSMIGAVLETAGLDPTVINGGIINAYGTNTRLGAGDWMAVEADESDGTFTRLPATVAVVTNIDPEHLDFYGNFAGLQRRFTKTGEWQGIAVIDDYGHHPVEIAAVLKAARAIADLAEGGGRVIAVVQPHRYSRLADLFDGFCTCFNDADMVLVADVYPAGEAPIEGVSGPALVAGLSAHGHRNARSLTGPEELGSVIRELARPGDMVVC